MNRCQFNHAAGLVIVGVIVFVTVLVASTGTRGRTRSKGLDLFATSDRCVGCHNNLVGPGGRDLSIGRSWGATMMAHSAKDPYWHAAVRRETIDHPLASDAIEDKCATCHMPISRFVERREGTDGKVLSRLPIGEHPSPDAMQPHAADGVSCSVCHQITPDRLGDPSSYTGEFVVDDKTLPGARQVYGPFEIQPGIARVMNSATGFTPEKGTHVQRSEFCATCHTLYTHALGPDGQETGVLPEQVPYLEWLESDYRDTQSCQDCHMETLPGKSPISSVLGQDREPVTRHVFRGGNFFMLNLLNRNRNALGVTAPSPSMNLSAGETVDHLKSSAASVRIVSRSLDKDNGILKIGVQVENSAGHKLPTAYPSRRVWIHLTVRDNNGEILFESGRLNSDGSIAGNDNDRDAALFEPHYHDIDDSEQVQIYEAILATPEGTVTTGLLKATGYIKDNRLPPEGFDKTAVHGDVAVWGDAVGDGDFNGGSDLVMYAVELENASLPCQITAEVWYQPIGFRWAHNLGDFAGPEPAAFISMYEAMPGNQTAVRLAVAKEQFERPASETNVAESDSEAANSEASP